MIYITEMDLTVGRFFGRLVYFKPKKLLFVVTPDGIINDIKRGKLPNGYRGPVETVQKLRATCDLTHVDTERETLFVDAFALTDVAEWAFKQKSFKTPKAFGRYFESLFIGDSSEFDAVMRAALRAAYRIEGPGEAEWYRQRALDHHAEAWTALQNGLQ